MATKNLLVKAFIPVRVPGETVQYQVQVADPLPTGDSQNAADFGDSITTAQCLANGGSPFNGHCTVLRFTSGGTYLTKYPVID